MTNPAISLNLPKDTAVTSVVPFNPNKKTTVEIDPVQLKQLLDVYIKVMAEQQKAEEAAKAKKLPSLIEFTSSKVSEAGTSLMAAYETAAEISTRVVIASAKIGAAALIVGGIAYGCFALISNPAEAIKAPIDVATTVVSAPVNVAGKVLNTGSNLLDAVEWLSAGIKWVGVPSVVTGSVAWGASKVYILFKAMNPVPQVAAPTIASVATQIVTLITLVARHFRVNPAIQVAQAAATR